MLSLQIAMTQGCCLGGSTIINDAVCIDPAKRVIDEWKNLGVDFTEQEWENHLNVEAEGSVARHATDDDRAKQKQYDKNLIPDMRIYCSSSADDLIYTNGNIEGVEGNFVDRDGNKTYRIRINSKIVS